jgi:serine phosphatase RsbU (regulator of sigma subunit)
MECVMALDLAAMHFDATEPAATAPRPEPVAEAVARLSSLPDGASDWIWETNTDHRLTFISKRFGEISGVPWEDVNGRSVDTLVALGLERGGWAAIRAATDARRVFHGIYRVDRPGGVVRYWRLTGKPVYDPDADTGTGAFVGYRGTGTDVTAAIEHEAEMTAALRRAEAAEREALQARQRLVDAIEAIQEGFVLHDADDRLVLCNARYREIYGLTPDMIAPGTPFEDTIRNTRKRLVDDGLDHETWVAERMRRHRNPNSGQIEQQLTSGRWLQVEERRTSDGGVVGIRVDVTEARRQAVLERDRERTRAELQAARAMQTGLLPSPRLQREAIARTGLDIASRSASCTELGGDLWGLTQLDRGRLGVYTIDVAGHGATAALNTFRLHTLIHELGAWLGEPSRFLKELNVRLAELLEPGTFATMFYGIVDPAENRIVYAAAGSPPPVIRCSANAPLLPLDTAGVPLGISVGADYRSAKANFEPGGMLFLYSDLLIDAMDEQGNRAGEEGAFAAIQRCAGEPTAEAMVERVCAPLFDPPGKALSDDLTVVCIRRP